MPTKTPQVNSKWMQKLEGFFQDGSVHAAREGSRSDSLALLKRFARNPAGADPALVDYVANCIGEWAEHEFKPAKAALAFHLLRPKYGAGVKGTGEKHVGIVETYLQGRAKGMATGQAIHQTAAKRHCSKKLVEKLIVGLHNSNDKRPYTRVQNCATRRVLAAADFDSGPLQRALGSGWDKWFQDARAHEERWMAPLRRFFGEE
jgi:hypothetical protein